MKNQTILISGASSGIGEATAAMLAKAGATVFGLARRKDALDAARARHPNVRWLLADVLDPTSLAAAVKTVVAETGRLDALVNNAAVFAPAPLADSGADMARAQFETNVLGLIALTRAALPALTASKGQIVNLSSAAGHKAVAGASIYGATKAAVESLTKSWAVELAPLGIRVNAIAPGPTDTPVFAKLPVPVEMHPQIKASFVAQVPLGRMASSDEVAAWIARAIDSTWMTGAVVAIDGGMSLT